MTWIDEHGVVHLVKELPKEVWQERSNATWKFPSLMAAAPTTGDGIVIIETPAVVAMLRSEYPRFHTYCGELRDAPGDSLAPPTCIECLDMDTAVGVLPEGYPWWR